MKLLSVRAYDGQAWWGVCTAGVVMGSGSSHCVVSVLLVYFVEPFINRAPTRIVALRDDSVPGVQIKFASITRMLVILVKFR